MNKARVGLLLLLLAAFALRLFRLEAQSIWWDEGISLHLAGASLREIFANRVVNIHPPLYFLGLKGWATLAGASAFSGRYLSVLASLLQVATIYGVCRRWFNRGSAWIAAVLVALSPLSVIYGQEIRVYAMLPLVYLALLAITRRLIHQERSGKSFYLLLGLIAWAGLHLHYIAFFAIIYISIWALPAFYRQRRRQDILNWVVTHVLVGVASMPWLLAVVANWAAVQREANAGAFLAEPAPLPFLISQVWVFHLTGLAGALRRPEAQWLAALVAALLVLHFLLRPRRRGRFSSLELLGHWLVPLSCALFVWSVRSFSHPRYVSMYAIGLFVLVAYVVYPESRRAGVQGRKGTEGGLLFLTLRAALAVSMIAVSLVGLRAYFFDPGFAKDDMRGVARYLEAEASRGDLILVPDGGWAFPLEYRGQAAVIMPGLSDGMAWTRLRQAMARLDQATEEGQRVFTVDSSAGSLADRQEVIPFALEKAGLLVNERRFEGLLVRAYQLQAAVEPPRLEPVDARFASLHLAGAWVETGVPADGAVAVALHWRASGGNDGARYGAALRLLDVDGWLLAAADKLLVDERGRPTEYWTPGQEVTTYHLMPIVPGTPPLDYTVALELYQTTADGRRPVDLVDAQGAPQGRQLALAMVEVAPASGLPGKVYDAGDELPPFAESIELPEGLRLLAASVDRNMVRAGQSLFVNLRWQAASAPLPDLRPRLSLVQAGEEVAFVEEAPVSGRYPTGRWQEGETVREHRRLVVPAAAAGMAEVVLSLGEQRVVLAEVEIVAEAHVFEQPAVAYPLDVHFGEIARLVGYDLPRRNFSTAEAIPVTLYWQASTGEQSNDYTVFVHLLDENGRLIAQHDAPPDNGRRPTSGWVSGEFIIDPHLMTFREAGYAGPATIEVGLYDPDTGERLTTPDGQDFVYLPLALEIGN